jgi:hypothetical protein
MDKVAPEEWGIYERHAESFGNTLRNRELQLDLVEISCSAEIKESAMTPLFPPDTNVPAKSGPAAAGTPAGLGGEAGYGGQDPVL